MYVHVRLDVFLICIESDITLYYYTCYTFGAQDGEVLIISGCGLLAIDLFDDVLRIVMNFQATAIHVFIYFTSHAFIIKLMQSDNVQVRHH